MNRLLVELQNELFLYAKNKEASDDLSQLAKRKADRIVDELMLLHKRNFHWEQGMDNSIFLYEEKKLVATLNACRLTDESWIWI